MPPRIYATGMETRSNGLGTLGALPDEVLDHILRGLDARTLALLSSASKVLHIFCTEEPLWLELHLARCKQPFQCRGSWRATYLACNPACRWPGCTAKDLRPPFQVPGFSALFLYRRWYRGHVDLSAFLPPQEAIQRLDAASLSPVEFEERFDKPSQPVLLRGLTKGWEVGEWFPERLAGRLGSRLFKVTKPSGGRMKMALSHYLDYCRLQHDEEPVYIFDPDFGETAPELLAAYSVPRPFRWDLFSWAGYARDEYRWLVAGPPRSGASWHVDPAATSAWNTSLMGRKRWALYPPGKVPPGVMVHVHASGEPDFRGPTSLQWFLEVYPHLPPEHRPLEVVQNPGETIFLPAGWWHCVLNLDMTVAVTQNFVSPANLEPVVAFLALGAGTLFDDSLVPAFLAQRQQAQQAQQKADKRGEAQDQGQQQGGGVAKRAAGPEPHVANGTVVVSGFASGGTSPSQDSGPSSGPSGGSSDTGDSTPCGMPRDAAAHLREAVLGFDRGGVLGRWLRAMWAGEPSLRPRLAELAERYTDLADWRRRLEGVCEVAGLSVPQPVEAFPLASGEAVVFELAGHIVKIFNSGFYPPGLATWQMETAAYLSMASAAQQAQHDHSHSATHCSREEGDGDKPAMLHCGALWDKCQGLLASADLSAKVDGEQDTACSGGKAGANSLQLQQPEGGQATEGGVGNSASHCWLPYQVVSKAAGVTLGSLQPQLGAQQWQQVAAAAGRALADFHALPLPQQPCQHAVVVGLTNGEQQDVTCGCSAAGRSGHSVASTACTAWISHRGTAWSSMHGRIDKSAWFKAAEGAAAATDETGNLAAAEGRALTEAAEGQQEDCHEELSKLSSRPLELPAELRLFPGVPLGSAPPTKPHLLYEAVTNGSVAVGQETKHSGSSIAVANGAEPCVTEEPAAKRAKLLQAAGAALGTDKQQGPEVPAQPMTDAAVNSAAAAAWQPFLAFLEHRRQRALRPHAWEGLLPPHLAKQVESYLPKDLSLLLGFSQVAPGSCCSLPAWVHGDLTAENILLQGVPAPSKAEAMQFCQGGTGASASAASQMPAAASSDSCKAVLIDFADGGQGDPLWDLPPLLLRSFRCNSGALDACLAAYRQRQQQLAASSSSSGGCSDAQPPATLPMLGCRQSNHHQEQHQGQGQLQGTSSPEAAGRGKPASPGSSSTTASPVRLSYVATCYTLLHELDLVEAAIKRRPELWEAASLEEVQQQLWGALDE